MASKVTSVEVLETDQENPNVVIHIDLDTGIENAEVEATRQPRQEKPSKLPLRGRRKREGPDPDQLTPGSGTPSDGQKKLQAQGGRLPFLTELLRSRRPKRLTRHRRPANPTVQSEIVPTIDTDSPLHHQFSVNDTTGETQTLKIGQLQKSTRSRKEGSKVGPARERRFRLTEEGIEYFQQFSNVKIKHSFPLTSVQKVIYAPETDPNAFELVFPVKIMRLVSESPEEAQNWVDKITDIWSKWQLPPETPSDGRARALDSLLAPTSLPRAPPESNGSQTPPSPVATASRGDKLPPPYSFPSPLVRADPGPSLAPPTPPTALSLSDVVTPAQRPRSHTAGIVELHRDSTQLELDTGTYDRRKKVLRRAVRIKKAVHLRPRLEKSKQVVKGGDMLASTPLHHDYAMIKYPRRKWSIPSERVFRVDKDNLQILWRKRETAQFNLLNSLNLQRVLEIREGQETVKFEKFPYEEVTEQSFSLIFEGVHKGGKYVRLASLDLICDHPGAYQEWMEGLRTLIPGPLASFESSRYDTTDPTILWLKTLWTCTSIDHEITQKDATAIAKKLLPGLSEVDARHVNKVAHQHQFRATENTGHALRWDGFVLMFSLLCGRTGRLFQLFREHAQKYPNLGMTQDEFRRFLINECCWEQRMCTTSELQRLMHHHDYHHRSFKKYIAENKPLEYQIASGLLSYAGFLSFLRSKDNSVINLEHEPIYQDMTQPLSHYFINSSHNTYLEADQLYGNSTTDAYVRALLQGCRCIEIDCWDDTFGATGVNEPIICHGYTLTTKLPFREVIQTIRKYAFQTSLYPIIISIENHCSSSQQAKMARIFRAVMGDVLAQENLTELEGRTRLPSPQELQGKIILKGSFKGRRGKSAAPKTTKAHFRPSPPASLSTVAMTTGHRRTVSSTSSLGSQNSQAEIPTLTSFSPDCTSPENDANELTFTVTFSQPHNRKSLREWTRSLKDNQSAVYEDDDQEVVFEETAEDLKQLIVYCRSISIKPWSWKKQQQTTVSDMFSFGEPSALRHCRDSAKELLACTERQLVRSYPRGTRFDSSNYSPITMWNCGIQMAAINFQFPDIPMHLNQGLFRLNGGCGYILKPAVMRTSQETVAADVSHTFLPDMTEPLPGVPPVELEIEVVSGQRLSPWKKKCTSISVEIHTYGIACDCEKMTPAAHNNSFRPQWQTGAHVFYKKIIMPELCLVYFRVEVVLKALGNAQLYGQNCIPLTSLMSGIKFVPLRTPGGELIQESGLFVYIKKSHGAGLTTRKYPLQHQGTLDESWEVWSSEKGERNEEGEEEEIDVLESLVPGAVRRKGNLQRQDGLSSVKSPKRHSSPPSVNYPLPSVMETEEEAESYSYSRTERGQQQPQHQDVRSPTQLHVISAEVHQGSKVTLDDEKRQEARPVKKRQQPRQTAVRADNDEEGSEDGQEHYLTFI